MSAIYVPHAAIEDTAADLVRNDLKLQARLIVGILTKKRKCRPEWEEYLSTLAYIGTLYVELLSQKYGDRSLNSARDILAIGMLGTHEMPEWTQLEAIHTNHRGFLKFLGLCRVYLWKHHKQPPAELLKNTDALVKAVKHIKLPRNARPDYSQYDVPVCNTLLKWSPES